MRIIGGIYGKRKLVEFENIGVRPTSDMVRESLFNILRDDVIDAKFLDLFAGTGAVGIEALSRGASHVVFNDNSKKSLDALNKNLKLLNVEKGFFISLRDGLSYLDSTNEKFDFIYLDPPYDCDFYLTLLSKAKDRLNKNGIIILETDKELDFTTVDLWNFDKRKYGRNGLYFFKEKLEPCVFAGTFDPITVGHEKLILECLNRHEKVVLTLGVNDQKQPYFTKEQRLDFIKRTFFDNDRLKIVEFSNLDDYKKTLSDIGVKYFVRGIRNSVDEYYEKSQIATNKKLYPEIETVFINAEKQYKNCSSSLVKELIEQNKNFKHLVPSGAYDKILEAVLKRK